MPKPAPKYNIQFLVKDIKESETNSIASVLAQLIRSKDDTVTIDSSLGDLHE